MKRVQDIEIGEFDYGLPEERIALHPVARRDECRLLVREPDGKIVHSRFSELAGFLPQGALLVRNNTRVINARMRFRKPTGATIEIFLLDPASPADYGLMFQSRGSCEWMCLVGNRKKWKEGRVTLRGNAMEIEAEKAGEGPDAAGLMRIRFTWQPASMPFADVVKEAGYIPIPPYLNRESEACDNTDYQTVYSRVEGSVAAPTAGLHFTDGSFGTLRRERGVETEDVTLHVGAGTFKPVKAEEIGGHAMHTETFEVSRSLVGKLLEAKRRGRSVVAVGTTSVRTLESLPLLGLRLLQGRKELHVEQWDAYSGEALAHDTCELLEALLEHTEGKITASTSIMIAPGFRWRITDAMVTNFHQPRSTLLLLVSSFMDRRLPEPEGKAWKEVYAAALREGYRFLSYGDGSLLL